MKSIYTMFRVMALAALISAGTAAAAESAIISIVPGLQSVGVGDAFSANVVISGLSDTEVVGALDIFELGFDDSIIIGTTIDMDPDGKFPTGLIGYADGYYSAGGTSPAGINMSADPDCDFACLKALQGDGFIIATLNFMATASGFSPLSLGDVYLFNSNGVSRVPFQTVDGGVCVGDVPCPTVPEPASLSLFAAGLAAAYVSRRRMKRRQQ